MTWLRSAAAAVFVLGLFILILALLSGTDERSEPEQVFLPVAETPQSLSATPDVAPASPTGAPTSTPAPYDGAVQSLIIPRFEVDSRIEAIGLVPGENQLDTPKDPHNTGWYEIYDRPGFGGNAVFSAHVDYYPDIRGPFFNLAKLEAGDEVLVEMANGQIYTYRVFFKQRYDVASIPTGELIDAPAKPDKAEWVTLITCGGRFRALNPDGTGPGEYLDRDVVIAERVDA